MDLSHIQPAQILCLEHENSSLYAEVIQVITARRLCWVRPLLLRQMSDRNQLHPSFTDASESVSLHDLRQSPDLICPAGLFRAALDTEVIPLLVLVQLEEAKIAVEDSDRLTSSEHSSEHQPSAHQLVRALIQQIWQAHPEAFQQ
jgi:hypothetical protein